MEFSKKNVEDMFNKGILISKDLLDKELDKNIMEKIDSEADLVVLNSDYTEIINQPFFLIDWYEIDRYRVELEKERDEDLYQSQLQKFQKIELILNKYSEAEKQEVISLKNKFEEQKAWFESKEKIMEIPSLEQKYNYSVVDKAVTVVISHNNNPHKYQIQDFSNFFISRYRFLENILHTRKELQPMMTIIRVLEKKEKEQVSIIGIVEGINVTKKGNLMITLEDLTGKINIIFSKSKYDLFKLAKDIVVDEVIGIVGVSAEKIIFAENIVWPDVPLDKELKKGTKDEFVIFLSDIHVGHKLFLKKEFEKFLKWLRGDVGNPEQRNIAERVKYIIIAGDLVDGVGVYPAQENELIIKDVKEQYQEFVNLIKKIPLDKQIIICPGNHDMVHLAEPQSVFYKEYAEGLFTLPNITLVSNPSLVNIGKTDSFPGFDILMYHGYSFDYYVSNVESIRMNGGYQRADLIMKFLLKRRHLAPSFTSTPYYPAYKEDPLLIKIIPDFFITGHIHYSNVANYKGITMISGSCWQSTTAFQEKMGHHPEPGRVPIVNLKTREVKVLRFV